MRSPALVLSLAALSASLLVAVSCATGRRGVPVAEPVDLDSAAARRGQIVFMQHCNQCHPGGDAGLGPALNNKPLPRGAMAAQIRVGLGTMPGFSEEHIPANDLEALITYLEILRRAPHP